MNNKKIYYWEAQNVIMGGQFVASSDEEAIEKALALRSRRNDLEIVYYEQNQDSFVTVWPKRG